MQVPNDKVKQQLDIAARRRAQGRSTSIDEAALNYAEKRYGYKAPAAPTLDDQYTNAQAQYNAAIERQNQLSNAGFGLRPALQQALNQRSPEFGLDRSALEARYGNPQSPLYIDNPFVRDAVIQRATSGQQQAFSTIADRLQGLLGLQTAQQGQLVQGLQNKVSNYGDQLTARQKAAQQEFENQLALQKLRQSGSRDGVDTSYDLEGIVDRALAQSGTDGFDLGAYAELLPNNQVGRFFSLYSQRQAEAEAEIAAQRQAEAEKRAAAAKKQATKVRPLSPGVKAEDIPPHLRNTFQNSPVLRQYIR